MEEAGHRLLEKAHDIWQRLLKRLLVKHHLMMMRTQERRGLRRIHQLVVRKVFSVTDGVSRPVAAMFVHQREQQAGIKSAA